MATLDDVKTRPLGRLATRQGLGMRVRAARLQLRWSQRRLAAEAAASQTLVSIVERGCRGASLESIERIAAAAGASLRLEPAGLPPSEGHSQTDAAHARCVGATRRSLEQLGNACATERPVQSFGRSGRIDLLAFDLPHRRLVVVEVKTELRDVGALERQVEGYVRGCLGSARELGWRAGDVFAVVIVLATADADAFALANRHELGGAFPVRGSRVLAAILGGEPALGRGLVMIDPVRRGRRAFMSLRVDGRRSEPPYHDVADFLTRSSRRRRPDGDQPGHRRGLPLDRREAAV